MPINLKGLALSLVLTLVSAFGAQAAASCGDNSGKPATGEPIVIGAITGKTGPDDFSNSTKAAKAYFDCLNANGGIKGRPVKYLVEDDQWNPEIAAQLAAKLVNDEKAVLMVGNSSFVECGANADFYKKSGILVVAGVGVPRECFFAENYAPTNAGPRVSMLGAMGYALDKLSAKSVVCIGPNIPNVGTWSCDGIIQIAKDKGLTAETILMDPGTADSTSTILQAAASKPDVIILGLPKGVTVPLLTAAEEQGLNQSIKFLSAASAYDLSVPGTIGAGWDGNFIVNMEFNDLEATTPDNQNWLAVMDQYGQKSDPRDTFAQAGYLSARIAEKALMTLDPGNITRETASAAVRQVKNFKSDIFCAPWYFGDGQSRHNANSTTRMAVSEGGKWKVVSDCAPSPDPELKDVRIFEKSAGLN
ncbi:MULTISPECIES: ABC transporter substrate-binding protein [Rhizobium]|uniref:ABC transporter substrate-binding protein n=1 Tax=Rhizobium lentis TaxID=1138194 RepID=A0ABS7IA04_9HYPH|nr:MULTISPECIES: ABC transporter substrate-binding protein [Rhizobium]MBX4922302.1 ABC transporter substrate-binding protein [Rhizobium bangladeshense]MBX5088309.1 ABC transporter substrate-binding protein [Rhizobium lentis]MBX5101191.1 ABC transporter substrate-binding protein [Rhizobium lentis]MBY3599259.1 ABC transporter substrate-binding protein [Rhizobium bangladeshense]